MPLTDFVRYLNAQLPTPTSALRSSAPFFSDAGKVFVHYADLRLDSVFSAIVDTATGELRGHAASLHIARKRDGQALAADALLSLPNDDHEFVFVDRLIRTLHSLNYLTYGERLWQELLLLKVHPRHVASVSATHGLAFEEILRTCGLLPGQVTLELTIAGVADTAHLARAVSNYKARGYGIAVNGFSGSDADFALLESIAPSHVRVATPRSDEPNLLPQWVKRLHALGSKVLIDGTASESVRADAWQSGVDYLQRPSSASTGLANRWSAAA